MALISLKCPNCDGEIQLDDNKESGFCLYCGSRLLFKDAVYKNKLELSGKINIEGVPTVGNLMLRGDEYVTTGDIDKAIEYYNKALDIDVGNTIVRSKLNEVFIRKNTEKVNPYIINGLELNQEDYDQFMLCINSGSNIAAIKVIRQSTGWEFGEAKDFVYNYLANKNQSKNNNYAANPDQSKRTNTANNANNNIPKKSGGCYIATAVYGSYEAPEVIVLRKFRDEVLLKSIIGRIFVVTYYAVSPPIANWLRNAKKANTIVRKILNRFVNKLPK